MAYIESQGGGKHNTDLRQSSTAAGISYRVGLPRKDPCGPEIVQVHADMYLEVSEVDAVHHSSLPLCAYVHRVPLSFPAIGFRHLAEHAGLL